METTAMPGGEHTYVAAVTRLRLGAEIIPKSWLRVTMKVQDAREAAGSQEIFGPAHDNCVDLQQAFADFGAGEAGRWNIRAGRQPLAFGDERLVGSDSFWCNRSQPYDGVRGTLRHGGWRWDLFSASPVEIHRSRPDAIGSSERLSGRYGSWSRPSGRT
jgi:hypothetical protein